MSNRKSHPINYAGMAQTVQNERKTQSQMQPSGVLPEAQPVPEKKHARPVSDTNIFTVQMTFRASSDQRDFLKRMALDNHTTVGDIIRWCIDSLEKGIIKYTG